MTTAQLQIRHPHRLLAMIALAAMATLASCTKTIEPYEPLASPYDLEAPVIIAVAPLLNESGTTLVDELQVADGIANTVQSIDGMSAIPINRTIAAMRSLGMSRVIDPEEASQLARLLGADGIVVGTITAWQPYEPPQIGMSLALFASSDALRGLTPREVDPRALSAAQTDYGLPDSWTTSTPVSTVSAFMDAEDPRVFRAIERYAVDRDEPPHALGPRKYTATMKLYAKFVSHELVSHLLDLESVRLAGPGEREENTQRR